jgi:hypothetical protein
MDTMTNLLVILLYLSALYTALALLDAAADGVARLAAWRPRRLTPSVERRPRRGRARRRVERDEPGAVRRPATAGPRPRAQTRSLS